MLSKHQFFLVFVDLLHYLNNVVKSLYTHFHPKRLNNVKRVHKCEQKIMFIQD